MRALRALETNFNSKPQDNNNWQMGEVVQQHNFAKNNIGGPEVLVWSEFY